LVTRTQVNIHLRERRGIVRPSFIRQHDVGPNKAFALIQLGGPEIESALIGTCGDIDKTGHGHRR